MRPRDVALLALCNIVWGLNAVAVKLSVEEMAPITAAVYRFLLVLLACLPWLRWLPGRMTTVVLAGLTNGALLMVFINLSFFYADNVAALAIVQQLGVPVSLLFGVVFLGERVRLLRILGVALSLGGVVLMSFDPAILHERLGLFLALVTTFIYSAGSLFLRKLRGVHPFNIYAWLSLMSLPILVGVTFVFEPGELGGALSLPLFAFAPVAFSAFCSSLIGQAGYAYLLQRYPISTMAPLTLPSPLISVASGVVFFGNVVTLQMVAGGLLVMLGVGIITVRSAQVAEPAKVAA